MIISDGKKIKVQNYGLYPITANKVVLVKGKTIIIAEPTDPDITHFPLAITLESFEVGSWGEVLLSGSLFNVNTNAYSSFTNTILYLTTNGVITATPGNVSIGSISKLSDTAGEIFINFSVDPTVTWGDITGTLADQTDLQEALDAKTNLEDINPLCKLTQTVTKGQAVYISSANGTNMLLSLASNDAEVSSSKTFGLAAASGVTNDFVRVITSGFLAGLDTSGANAAGDPVWLGVDGQLLYGIANKPYAPAHLVFIGIVTRKNNSNGEIYIRVQNGFELDELHNVDAKNPSNNDGIFYNTSTSLWEHKSIATVLGYTPYDGSTNSLGFLTSSALTGYLTSATAASTYQPIISLTTTGTSGAATLIGNTLNIPQYSSGSGSTTQIFSFQLANVAAAGATTWVGVGVTAGSNETTSTLVMPVACTLSDMYTMHYTTAQPATGSQVFTVRKNGADTALSITIAAGSAPTTTPYSNLANSVSFAVGDKFAVRRVNNATTTGGAVNGLSFKMVI